MHLVTRTFASGVTRIVISAAAAAALTALIPAPASAETATASAPARRAAVPAQAVSGGCSSAGDAGGWTVTACAWLRAEEHGTAATANAAIFTMPATAGHCTIRYALHDVTAGTVVATSPEKPCKADGYPDVVEREPVKGHTYQGEVTITADGKVAWTGKSPTVQATATVRG
jgi:hypothetical protein